MPDHETMLETNPHYALGVCEASVDIIGWGIDEESTKRALEKLRAGLRTIAKELGVEPMEEESA